MAPPEATAAPAAADQATAPATPPEGTPTPDGAALTSTEHPTTGATVDEGADINEANTKVEEIEVAGPTEHTRLSAKGQRVLYRAASKNQHGEDGEEFHAGIITKLNADWTAELTVFPNGRATFHVHLAKLSRVDDPSKLEAGEWVGNS